MPTFHARPRAATVAKEDEKLNADAAIPHSVKGVSGNADHCRLKKVYERRRGVTVDKTDQDLQVLA